MSYIALVTDRFDAMAAFYGEALGCRRLEAWDRENARGARFDLGGFKLELLDNARERPPLALEAPQGRVHLVIEVNDVRARRAGLSVATPEPVTTSWGALLFQIRDPDGVAVTFLEWTQPGEATA